LLSKIYLTNNNNLKDRPISTVTVGKINFEMKDPLAFALTKITAIVYFCPRAII